MVTTKCKSTEDMINKLQQVKGKRKLKFHQNNNYYDQLHYMRQCNTFLFEEHPSAVNVQGIGNIFHEEPFLVKFLQTRLQIAIPLTSEAVTDKTKNP